MTKAEELINKHLDRLNANNIIGRGGNIYKGFLNAINEALTIPVVSNWVAIESEEQPERVTDVMVMYKDNRKEVAFFDGDGRFYTQNDDDITDKIARWHKLP